MLDARDGENVPRQGSTSTDGEFIIDVNYCNTAERHVYFRPEPHADLRYLGTVDAEDVDDLIEFVRAEQDTAQDKAEFGALAVGIATILALAVFVGLCWMLMFVFGGAA